MAQDSSTFPISRLIAQAVDDSGLPLADFALRLGYRNSAKGFRRLERWLANGYGDAGCLRRIVDAFHLDPREIENALADTKAQRQRESHGPIREIEERERRLFRPFIWVDTATGARSSSAALHERQLKVLWMPKGFENLDEDAKLNAVRQRVRAHYNATGGRYIDFGAILRYRYANTFDMSIVLDIHGHVIDERGGRSLLPEVWLALHANRLPL
jgi:hypothetical protein